MSKRTATNLSNAPGGKTDGTGSGSGTAISYATLPTGHVQLAGGVWVTTRSEQCAVSNCNEHCWFEGVHQTYGCCASQIACGWDALTKLACSLAGTNPGAVTIQCRVELAITYGGWDSLDQRAYPIDAALQPFTVTGPVAADGSFGFDGNSAVATGHAPGNWVLTGNITNGQFGGDLVLTVDNLRVPDFFGGGNGVLAAGPKTTVLWQDRTCDDACAWPRGASNAFGAGIDLTDYCENSYGVDATLQLDSSRADDPSAWSCVAAGQVHPYSFSEFTNACVLQQGLQAVHQGAAGDPMTWFYAAT